jgi:hypothetical protein
MYQEASLDVYTFPSQWGGRMGPSHTNDTGQWLWIIISCHMEDIDDYKNNGEMYFSTLLLSNTKAPPGDTRRQDKVHTETFGHSSTTHLAPIGHERLVTSHSLAFHLPLIGHQWSCTCYSPANYLPLIGHQRLGTCHSPATNLPFTGHQRPCTCHSLTAHLPFMCQQRLGQ